MDAKLDESEDGTLVAAQDTGDDLAAREAAYKQADVLVNTEQRSIKEITAHVLHHFRAAQQSPPRL